MSRLNGNVKWFDPGKGYGFISPESGGADVFVHVTALNGLDRLREDDRVSFVIGKGRNGKPAATDVRRA